MLPNYDTHGIGMHHYITEPCICPLGMRVSFQVLFHRWHNDDPVWSVQCNARVPSTDMSACSVPFHRVFEICKPSFYLTRAVENVIIIPRFHIARNM